jgi:hypothetical protein
MSLSAISTAMPRRRRDEPHDTPRHDDVTIYDASRCRRSAATPVHDDAHAGGDV